MEIAKFDILGFRNMVIAIVEELKMCRNLRTDNDKRIEKLLAESLEMKQQLAERNETVEALHRKLDDVDVEESEKLKRRIAILESEKGRLNVASTQADGEVKLLKEEVCRLQMSVYSRNQQLVAYEQQIRVLTSQSTSIMNRMQETKQSTVSLDSKMDFLEDLMQKLQRSVNEAVEVNRKLQLTNTHRNCEMEELRSMAEASQRRMLAIGEELQQVRRSATAQRPFSNVDEDETTMEMILEATRVELDHARNIACQCSEKYQELLTTYNGCLATVNRQTNQISDLETIEKECREEVQALRASLDKKETSNASLKKELVAERNRMAEEKESLTKKILRIDGDLQGSKSQVKAFEEQVSDLEQQIRSLRSSNSSLRDSNGSLREEMKTLRDALTPGAPPRCDAAIQTAASGAVAGTQTEVEACPESPVLCLTPDIEWSPPCLKQQHFPRRKRVRFAEILTEVKVTSSCEDDAQSSRM